MGNIVTSILTGNFVSGLQELNELNNKIRPEIEKGRVNCRNRDGDTWLMRSIKIRHHVMVALLFQQPDLDVNCKNKYGFTAMHIACMVSNIRDLRLLVAHPEMRSLNARNKGGLTPIGLAVHFGQVDCVREMMGTKGVDLDTKDDGGDGLEEMAR